LKDLEFPSNKISITIKSDGSSTVSLFGIKLLDATKYQSLVNILGCGFDRNLVALYIPNSTEYYNELRGFVLRDEVLRWIEKNGFHRRVAEKYISKVVYDRFTEVLKRDGRLALRKEVAGGVGPLYIDIDSVGEGVRRFVLTYFVVEYLNPKIVLWDDVEVAAHPSLLELVIRWLSESGRQVVISTHSLDVLYALTLVKPRNAAVVVLRKTADDVVEWRHGDKEPEKLCEQLTQKQRAQQGGAC